MAGSIAEVYAQVKLSVSGIHKDLMSALNPSLSSIKSEISDAVKAGFSGVGSDVSNELSNAIENGIQNANFGNVTTGIQQGLNGVDFSNVGNDLQSSIESALSSVSASGLSSNLSSITSSISSDLQSAVSSINVSNLQTDLSSITSQISQDLQSSINSINTSSLQSSLNSTSSSLSSQIQNSLNSINTSSFAQNIQQQISQQVQQGAQQGLNGVTPPTGSGGIQGGVQGATQNGAVSGFKKAGPAIIAGLAALGIGAMIKGSISSAIEKDMSQTKISAQLNLDANAERSFKEASTMVWQSGLSDSRDEVNETLGAIISSSEQAKKMGGKELGALGKQMQTLVTLYDLSADEMAEATAGMVNTGMADNMGEAADLLTAAMTQAPAQARDEIVSATSEFARNYESLGLDGVEMMASFVKGAKKGSMGVDKVGDGIKEVTLKVGGLDKSASEALSSMGMSGKRIKEFQKAFAVGGDTGSKAFKDMLRSVQAIQDPVKKQQTAIALFGTQMEDLGANNFDEFSKSILDADLVLGDANRISAGVQDKLGTSFAVQAQGFKNTWSDITATMGMGILTQIMPHMKTLLDFLKTNGETLGKDIGNVFGTLVKEVLPAIIPLLSEIMPIVSAIIALIVPIVETMIPIIKDAIPMIQSFMGFVLEVVKSIEPIIPALLVVAGVVAGLLVIAKIVAVVQTLIGLFATLGITINLAFWPVTLIIIAIAAVIAITVLLVKNWDAVKAAILGAWESVSEFFGKIGGGIADLWNGMISGFSDVGNFVMGIIGDIIRGFQEAIGWITSFGKDEFNMNINATANGQSMPAMATGGDVMGATALIAGEKDPETIVNRGVMNKNLEHQNSLIDSIMSGENNGVAVKDGDNYNITINGANMTPKELVDAIEQEKERRKRR